MGPTRALIVYKTLFGNTAVIARAIAQGLRDADAAVECLTVDDVCLAVEDVDLVVLGAPTHFWGLTRTTTRAMELHYERRLGPRRDATAAPVRTAAETVGMRSLVAALRRAGDAQPRRSTRA